MTKHSKSQSRSLEGVVEGYLTDPRLQCCLQAAAELAALAMLLRRYLAAHADGMAPLGAQAILVRMQALSAVVQDGLGDAMVTTKQIAAVVYLQRNI